MIVLAVACRARGFSIDLASALEVAVPTIVLGVGARIVRQRGWLRIADYLTTTAQMVALTASLTALSYVLASINLPLQDAALISLDAAIGIDWKSVSSLFMHQQSLMIAMNLAYTSIDYQVLLILPVLALFNRREGGTQFVLAWSLALSATVLISPLVPSIGAVSYYGIEPKDLPQVHILAAWRFVEPFSALRNGSLNILDLDKLDGIVNFPAFTRRSRS
jgi:PAP2 superfamily